MRIDKEVIQDGVIQLIPREVQDRLPAKYKLFPNPVLSGSNLTIEWQEKAEGNYVLSLSDVSGKQMFQMQVWMDNNAKVLDIDIPVMAHGNYFLQISNTNRDEMFTEKLVIE